MPTLLGISRILVVWIQFVCHTIQFGSQILFFTISKYPIASLIYYILCFLLQSTQTTYANFLYFFQQCWFNLQFCNHQHECYSKQLGWDYVAIAWNLQKLVWHRCWIFPVRCANMQTHVGFMDLRWAIGKNVYIFS